ncbi:hypothetical protein E2C01_047519 [Portunus trituberculatus]|uniref:Uncharacterized protein n=1 Tax=Portunus trituberculatus TaxID=210409 RepID=A0A5B7G940_PORTR|nr:hypothetical protein [Portunus trituberculatus]
MCAKKKFTPAAETTRVQGAEAAAGPPTTPSGKFAAVKTTSLRNVGITALPDCFYLAHLLFPSHRCHLHATALVGRGVQVALDPRRSGGRGRRSVPGFAAWVCPE